MLGPFAKIAYNPHRAFPVPSLLCYVSLPLLESAAKTPPLAWREVLRMTASTISSPPVAPSSRSPATSSSTDMPDSLVSSRSRDALSLSLSPPPKRKLLRRAVDVVGVEALPPVEGVEGEATVGLRAPGLADTSEKHRS